MKFFFSILLIFALIFTPISVKAFETDQFILPPVSLADVGDEVFEYVRENIEKAVLKINSQITEAEDCLSGKRQKNCELKEKLTAKLQLLRSPETVEREVFRRLGSGIVPFTSSQIWLDFHEFKNQPARFKPDFSKSIYRVFPSNYLTLSPTIKIYGVSLGTDKIAHIFQQGFTYLQIVKRNQARGLSEADAIKKAIAWGRKSENTFYGFWASGVFSNADLAANFAGLKFYRNLTAEITAGEKSFQPILELKDGFWGFTQIGNFFQPFISNHLSEAWTPSIYASVFGLRGHIRKTLKANACDDWKKLFPDYSKTGYEAISQKLETWNGADYGFKKSNNFLTIASVCF